MLPPKKATVICSVMLRSGDREHEEWLLSTACELNWTGYGFEVRPARFGREWEWWWMCPGIPASRPARLSPAEPHHFLWPYYWSCGVKTLPQGWETGKKRERVRGFPSLRFCILDMWGFRYPPNCVCSINAYETQHMPKHTALQQGAPAALNTSAICNA